MKKIILATVATMLSMQAWGEVKLQPTQVLKAKAYVYKVKSVESQDGSFDDVTTEVCNINIHIPIYKGDTNSNSDFSLNKHSAYCHSKILDHEVTLAFGSLVYDVLIKPGKITSQYGLNTWINKRANMIIGTTWVIPGHVKPFFDNEKNEMNWGSDNLPYEQYQAIQDLAPSGYSSVNVYRGSYNQGFMSFLELQNYDVCNRIPDQDRRDKCSKDGYFRVLITFEGKN